MKIKEAIIYFESKLNSNGISDYKKDVEIIFSHLFNMNRIDLILKGEDELSKEEFNKVEEILEMRINHIPVSEIFHEAEFYGMHFKVTSDVLTPRKETELVLMEALNILEGKENLKVLDLCTGSGILGISIKKEYPNSYVTISDISDKALEIAKENAKINNVDLEIIKSNMFNEINKKFDLIISNPPYIPKKDEEELEIEVIKYDPKISLFGGDDGLDFYRIIGKEVGNYLNENGSLVLEIGYNQGDMVKEILEKEKVFKSIIIKKDFSNFDRIIIAKK